jgi:hypothetical protein
LIELVSRGDVRRAKLYYLRDQRLILYKLTGSPIGGSVNFLFKSMMRELWVTKKRSRKSLKSSQVCSANLSL